MYYRFKAHSKTLLTFVFLNFFWFIHAQNGTITGIVTDKNNSETIIGATVMLEGTTTGAITDLDGRYVISNIKPGSYKLSISFISYEAFISPDIIVNAGETVNYNISLATTSINLSTVNVMANRKTGNDVAVISNIRGSVSLANGISSQLISKTQDKDAADVVKRIPGITIIDDKFIIVRGLSQRYNSVWLNNAATPSSEADNKAFSFDVVPSSMIDNIMVYKTAQADFPADYTGGFIRIITKAIPDQNEIQVSYSAGYNQGISFNKFYRYEGSKTDWLGFDNGFRALPSDMPANLQEFNSAQNPVLKEKALEMARSLNKSWTPQEMTAMPDQRLSIGFSRKFSIGKITAGNYTALTYGNSFDFNDIEKNNAYSIYNYAADQISPLDEFSDKQYTNTSKIGLIHNWAFSINERNKIEFRHLFNQIGYTRTSMRQGREWYNDGRYIQSTDLSFVSRMMYSGQIGGNHTIIDDKNKIDWVFGYSFTNKKEPDNKRYRYIANDIESPDYILLFPENGDLSSQSRRWVELEEKLFSGGINYTRNFNFMGQAADLKLGAYYEKKNREFSARNFGYASTGTSFLYSFLSPDQIFTDANHNLTDGIKMIENTSKSDSYDAGFELMAGYVMVKIPVSKFNINLGLRIENDNQHLNSFRTGTSIRVNPQKDTLNLFPSANVIYNLNEKTLLRLAYGKTVNRPEFREIAPFYFVDFELNAGIYGNENIKQAYINNFDLRYEYYPSADEMITFGLFYKQIKDAIEFIILGNSPTQYSFTNVESAYNYGIELEFKKDLEFIGLKNFAATFNGSLIKSQIKSGTGELSRERPLQGQSPYILNAGLFYQNEKHGLNANLVYNIIGKRIVAVGRPMPNQWEDIPDVYESPRNLIDFTISKKIGRNLEIKAGVRDLLNQKTELIQTVDTDVDMSIYGGSGIQHFNREQVIKQYYPGRSFSLGLSLKI